MNGRVMELIGMAVVLYPLVLSLSWCLLALLWSWRWERPERWQSQEIGRAHV